MEGVGVGLRDLMCNPGFMRDAGCCCVMECVAV